jgi:hypothetical protein
MGKLQLPSREGRGRGCGMSEATDATIAHIRRVKELLSGAVGELLERAEKHDASKLVWPEVAIFEEFTGKLKHSTYGSDEYRGFLAQMKPALDHHYFYNRHHPEHFAGGIDEMTLIDLLEMFCDWKAASERHADGSAERTLQVNGPRFGMSEQLVTLFRNTFRAFEGSAARTTPKEKP